jgi:hypothetical protein
MEFYPADEAYNPNPGRPTVETFSGDVSDKDVLGEIFSHLLPNIDPDFRNARAEFVKGIDSKQKKILFGDYKAQVRSGLAKDKSFDDWLQTNGGDAFFRGYIADQYPKEFYRPDQVQMFSQLMGKLGEEPSTSSATDPWSQFQDAPGQKSDSFAGDPLLSNEAMSRLAAGERSTITPSPDPSPFRGVKDYFAGIDQAMGRFNRAPGTAGIGTLEAAASLGSGAVVAPILGTAEAIALGKDPDETFAKYTYQPRTESGQAQLGVLGALARPLTESGADVALAPLFAGESRALAANPARIPRNARGPRVGSDPVPAEPAPLAGPGAAGETVSAPTSPAGKAGLVGLRKEAIPTRVELAEAAKAAYKKADEAGVVVSENSLKGLKTRIVSMAKKEGIDKDLHPDASAALKRIVQSKGDLTLTELETLRKVAKDAQGSIKPSDKRLAGKIVDELDDYIDNLGDADVVAGDATKIKALKEARSLYSRAKKSEVIEELMQRAQDSASQFSGSGLENSIRTQFRSLAKNKKQMRMFTAEEQAAIRKVAQGGPIENAARFVGKFAPTGVVSGVLSGGAGVAIGGPFGAALPLAGLGGRSLATRLTLRNVKAADELMRRGPAGSNALAKQAAEQKRNAFADF